VGFGMKPDGLHTTTSDILRYDIADTQIPISLFLYYT
jgi:hypothetical protein